MPVYTYSTIDDPSAANFGTFPSGYQSGGQIVGSGGTYTALDDPLAFPGSFQGTNAQGINDSGQIVGFFINGSGYHGFLLGGDTYTSLDDPLATQGTFASGINDAGQIVGYYKNATGFHGFLFDPNSGIFPPYFTLNDPLATDGTWATGINDAGRRVRGWAGQARFDEARQAGTHRPWLRPQRAVLPCEPACPGPPVPGSDARERSWPDRLRAGDCCRCGTPRCW
jgi:probable HAF family extracellular repeat protein